MTVKITRKIDIISAQRKPNFVCSFHCSRFGLLQIENVNVHSSIIVCKSFAFMLTMKKDLVSPPVLNNKTLSVKTKYFVLVFYLSA